MDADMHDLTDLEPFAGSDLGVSMGVMHSAQGVFGSSASSRTVMHPNGVRRRQTVDSIDGGSSNDGYASRHLTPLHLTPPPPTSPPHTYTPPTTAGRTPQRAATRSGTRLTTARLKMVTAAHQARRGVARGGGCGGGMRRRQPAWQREHRCAGECGCAVSVRDVWNVWRRVLPLRAGPEGTASRVRGGVSVCGAAALARVRT